MSNKTFEMYLIQVGMRSLEYTHSDESIFENIDYFKKCYYAKLSAYKALLFLQDYIDGDYVI